jgi:hypothetical protein
LLERELKGVSEGARGWCSSRRQPALSVDASEELGIIDVHAGSKNIVSEVDGNRDLLDPVRSGDLGWQARVTVGDDGN